MLALLSFLWTILPYVFIVYIGDYITRNTAIYNMQFVDPTTPPTQEGLTGNSTVKRTRSRRKKTSVKKVDKDFEFQTDSEDQLLCTTVNIDKKYLKNYSGFYATEDVRNAPKIFSLNTKMSKYFVVNESVFVDVDPTMVSDEECQDYKLYKVMKTESGTDEHKKDELTEDDLTEALFITEEMTWNGIIINNNVYLSHKQWHTIAQPSPEMYSCTVCDFECDEYALDQHISSLTHMRKLDKYKPLKRFDLSITRKINGNLHCGVCNELFPIHTYREHENSKTHEGCLLFAINKVSDLMWTDQDQKLTQTIQTNNIQPPNNAPYTQISQDVTTSSNRDDWVDNIGNENVDRHCEINRHSVVNRHSEIDRHSMDRQFETSRQSEVNRFDTHQRDRSVDSDRNSDRSSSRGRMSDRQSDFDNEFINNDRSEHNFNFGKSVYQDIKIYEEDELDEYTLPIEGVSYASMASKPRLDVPKYLKIDLGTKEVRVKYESWNMITQTNVNEYYCMVCTMSFLVRYKNKHCLDENHKRVLSNCTVVGAFEDYLIRDVSEKLYHCGHCNNLQYKNDMKIHVEKYHPVKNPKTINDTQNYPPSVEPIQKLVDPKKKPVDPKKKPVDLRKILVDPKQKLVEPIHERKSKMDIFGDFTFTPFGAAITVSNLGCHTLMLVDNKYVCAICNVSVQGDLIDHVYEVMHMRLINMTPFIRPFKCNLTRAVRGSLHCALCNILIPVTAINDHNIAAAHVDALARALGMVKKERPKQEIKYNFEEPNEFKSELERFLSTLSPSTRGALSRFKIKNPRGEMFELSDTSSNSSSSNGSSTPISISNSPEHTKNITKEHNNTINPQDGVIKEYPKEIAAGVMEEIVPKNVPNLVNTVAYPSLQNPYNFSYKPKMLTVSMVESGLPRARPCSPNYKSSIDLKNTLTESIELKNLLQRDVTQPINMNLKRPDDFKNKVPGHDMQNNTWIPKPMHRLENIEANQIVNQKQVSNKTKESSKIERDVSQETKIDKDIKVHEKSTFETLKPEVKKKKKAVESEKVLPPFKLDEVVLLKLKSSYFEVTSTAYHTLVHLGSGMRHCFVCSSTLDYSALTQHVDSTKHIDKIDQNKFLYNFSGQLLRQMYRTYHCTICNVTMSRQDVKVHLGWRIHIEKYNICCKKLNKKVLKDVLKSGAKEFNVLTQKECLYDSLTEPIHIITYIQSTNKDFEETDVEKTVERKSQIIILKGNAMKISFEFWHGVLVSKSGLKCIICQQELSDGVDKDVVHLSSSIHLKSLAIGFEKKYYPALIRKINNNTVNCVICNLELPNDEALVTEHISGRKHYKKYNAIIETSSHIDSSDCKHPIILN